MIEQMLAESLLHVINICYFWNLNAVKCHIVNENCFLPALKSVSMVLYIQIIFVNNDLLRLCLE